MTTAERIYEFLNGKLGLEKNLQDCNFCSDHALFHSMDKCMLKLGVDVELKWNVCGSHNACNIANAANAEFHQTVFYKDWDSKCLDLTFDLSVVFR